MDLTLAHRPQSTVYSPKGQVDILPATRVFVRRCSLTFLVPHQRASLPIRSLLVGLTLIVMAISAPRMAAQKVDLSIDASKPGAKIAGNLSGQSPSISDTAFTTGSGSAPIPPFRIHAAF